MKVKYGKIIVELADINYEGADRNDSIGSIKDRLLTTLELPQNCRDEMKLIYQGHVLHNDLLSIVDVVSTSSKSMLNTTAAKNLPRNDIEQSINMTSHAHYDDIQLVLICNPKKSHDVIDPKMMKILQHRVVDDISITDDDHHYCGHSISSKTQSSSRETAHNPYKFQSIQTLSGLPDEDKARAILESLANDVGQLSYPDNAYYLYCGFSTRTDGIHQLISIIY